MVELKKSIKGSEIDLNFRRRRTVEVKVGRLPIGGKNPIRLQSMTNTDTMDTESTARQAIEIFKAGAELVRITVPTPEAAKNLGLIKRNIDNQRFNIPLVADVHFNPAAAEIAAKIVEKVRINPGNFIDKAKTNESVDFTEESFAAGLSKIESKFSEFIDLCYDNNVAIRIGTNHGSLSDRIMWKYGDTPEGMVESTMEFLRVCRRKDFHKVVVSLKSSNTRVMVQATRLLAQKMDEEYMHYPLHLGVTEAGEGEDGRIKSALGIGALLSDGIGDTIRVSLTENPVNEIPVAKKISNYISTLKGHKPVAKIICPIDPFSCNRRESRVVDVIGGNQPPVIFSTINLISGFDDQLNSLGYEFSEETGKWEKLNTSPEFIRIENVDEDSLPQNFEGLNLILDYNDWLMAEDDRFLPEMSVQQYLNHTPENERIRFIRVKASDIDELLIKALKCDLQAVLILTADNHNVQVEQRFTVYKLIQNNSTVPIIVENTYSDVSKDDLIIKASCDYSNLIIDALIDGISIIDPNIDIQVINNVNLSLLQAGRLRMSKTEFISCPGCGRTLFDLEPITREIKEKLGNFRGLKIAIMGCIVNGIGEMADADYGYVGSGKGKVSLYKDKTLIDKNIPQEVAVEKLIEIIKADNR